MSKTFLYADNNGSSQLLPEVKDYLLSRLTSGPFANPSSIHSLGQSISLGLSKCRKIIADAIKCDTEQIIFTSCASESISQIFHSVLTSSSKKIILSSQIEHAATVEALKYYEQLGFKIAYINTKRDGTVDLEHYKSLLELHNSNIALVCVIAANNETGVIQPYKSIGALAHDNDLLFFSDTTQVIAKLDFSFEDSNIDFAVASSHKMGALVGSGLLLTKEVYLLKSIIFGGGQEKHKRGGTENYIAIETMALSLQIFDQNKIALDSCEVLKEKFEKNILKSYPQVTIIGESAPRLACTSLLSFPGIHGQAVQIELEAHNIFVTTSSACGDNEPETSHVLKAMGCSDTVGRGVIRLSFSANMTSDQFQTLEIALINIYKKLDLIKGY